MSQNNSPYCKSEKRPCSTENVTKSDGQSKTDRSSDKTSELNKQDKTYEVFRNRTTAVEVTVKEINNAKRKFAVKTCKVDALARMLEENEKLRADACKNEMLLRSTRKSFSAIVNELKKQLDDISKRELDGQMEIINLKLENEKLKTLMETKTCLLDRLKKEMSKMKKVLKFVIKGMYEMPKLSDGLPINSGRDYDDFENDLKKDVKFKMLTKMDMDGTMFTNDSNLSKDSDVFTPK